MRWNLRSDFTRVDEDGVPCVVQDVRYSYAWYAFVVFLFDGNSFMVEASPFGVSLEDTNPWPEYKTDVALWVEREWAPNQFPALRSRHARTN